MHKAKVDGTYTGAGIPVVRQRAQITFADYAADWAEVVQGEKNTRRAKRRHVLKLNLTFGGKLISDNNERTWPPANEK